MRYARTFGAGRELFVKEGATHIVFEGKVMAVAEGDAGRCALGIVPYFIEKALFQ